MCKSGKDRTGLAEHYITAIKIAGDFGVDITQFPLKSKALEAIKSIHKQVLNAGHTAQQAGDSFSLGGGIGAMGTKSETKAAIPKNQKKALESIVSVSAKTNKIKGKSKLKKENFHYQPLTKNPLLQTLQQDLLPNVTSESFHHNKSKAITARPIMSSTHRAKRQQNKMARI